MNYTTISLCFIGFLFLLIAMQSLYWYLVKREIVRYLQQAIRTDKDIDVFLGLTYGNTQEEQDAYNRMHDNIKERISLLRENRQHVHKMLTGREV